MNCIRPGIAYAVSHNPGNDHWAALYCLLRYLKGTRDLILHFHKYPAVIDCYCDANWVFDNDEVASASVCVYFSRWSHFLEISNQSCIANSTMESECIALELVGREAEWLRILLAEVPLGSESTAPIRMHCDSQAAAIGVAKNSVYNGIS